MYFPILVLLKTFLVVYADYLRFRTCDLTRYAIFSLQVMVPLGNIIFSFKFIPGHKDIHATDIIGLIVILQGKLIVFSAFIRSHRMHENDSFALTRMPIAFKTRKKNLFIIPESFK